MNTTSIGNEAEHKDCQYLEDKGFKILERNWRTKWCEIDIVAKKCSGRLRKQCRIHIVEVKFRKTDSFGRPEEFVGRDKLRQLVFGAESWAHEHEWDGDIQIDVVAVDGASDVVDYIPNVTV